VKSKTSDLNRITPQKMNLGFNFIMDYTQAKEYRPSGSNNNVAI
jgi:hypothetical protein